MCTDATHFHVDIRCHVNLIGPITKWRDSNISRATPFDVTHFGSKSKSVFLMIYHFSIIKNK
jgi:hypothetical protein